MLDWIDQNGALVGWLGAGAIALSVASLLALPWMIGSLPVDYFVGREAPALTWQSRLPALSIGVRIARNVLGFLLVLAGIGMLVLPGQGVLTILVGLVMAEYPGKRRLERWLVARPRVLSSMNWFRRRMKRPPLLPPDEESEDAATAVDG